jgi:DNA-binding NarL/FixJ family response regulator
LVVDSDTEFAGMVAQAMSDADDTYVVTVQANAQEAMACVQEARTAQRPFDLAIVDVRTPGADSMRMIEELTQSCPELKIVTMTAYHSPELAARVQQAHVHTHLIKPVAPSQFRQLVQDALAGESSAADRASPPSPLADAQQVSVERQLANLRRATDSIAALLVHTSGTIRAMDCLEPDLNADMLGTALMEAQHSIAQALAQAVQAPSPIRQSYFGTASYSVCVHRLDETHTVATIFGPEVREGQVWYAIREQADALRQALEDKGQESPAPRSAARNDGFDMVERYFAEQASARARPRRGTHEGSTSPRNPSVDQPPVWEPQAHNTAATPDQDEANTEIAPTPAPLKMKRLQIDEIDWGLGDSQDWDTLAVDMDQSSHGLSFEEAKERGLLDDLEAEP